MVMEDELLALAATVAKPEEEALDIPDGVPEED